jgi:excinuclease ABC subunit B
LPSAADNRPLKYEEFDQRVGQTIYVSATPSKFERSVSEQIVEQIIRPTGLIDPEIVVLPAINQVQDLIPRIESTIKLGERVLVTTLTKKMAEDLSGYLADKKIKVTYLHSDIKALDRIRILTSLRKGEFDVLVGVNLLREGLDLPEVSLVAILDADKEGFLRSETSLIQTVGRAARNVKGKVLMYADNITGSMERAISETNRRRAIQEKYNKDNNITPTTIIKEIKDSLGTVSETLKIELSAIGDRSVKSLEKIIKQKEKEMREAAKQLDFEVAALLRDEIKLLKEDLACRQAGLEEKKKEK